MSPDTAQATLNVARLLLLAVLLLVCNRLGCAVAWEAAEAGRWGWLLVGTAAEWAPLVLSGWWAARGWSEGAR